MTYDLNDEIFTGNIRKALFRISFPVLWGMLAELFYSITDTFYIALIDKSNTAILSGVGLVLPIPFIIIALTQGFFFGTSTITAISVGKKDMPGLKNIVYSGFILALFTGVVFTGIMLIFRDEIITLLAGNMISNEARQYAADYYIYIVPGALFMFTSHIFMGVLQGEGKTKYIGIVMTITTIMNFILDPVFIFILEMGVKGAAIATLCSQVPLLLYSFYAIKKHSDKEISNLRNAKFELKYLRQVVKLGFPQSLGFMALGISMMLINNLVGQVSETFMNSFILVSRIDQIIFIPVMAIAFGMSTLLGQNYGRELYGRVREIYNQSTMIMVILVVIISLGYMCCAGIIFSAFTSISEVKELAVRQVYYISIVLGLGSALEIAASSTFQAIAQPVKSFFVTTLRIGLISLPLAYYFTYKYGAGYSNIWIALALGNMAGGIISYFWIRREIVQVKNLSDVELVKIEK